MGRNQIAFAFVCVLFSIAGGSTASATCHDPREVCGRIYGCLNDLRPQRTDDRTKIIHGIDDKNGNEVWVGADACQVDLGQKSDWDADSGSCTDDDYLELASRARDGGADACADMAKTLHYYCGIQEQNGWQRFGEVVDGGTCVGTQSKGSLCDCGGRQGQVYIGYR